MLKLYVALGLALVVGTLTLTNGIFYGARLMTIFYRVLISIAIFGIAGYFLGFAAEKFVNQLLLKDAAAHEQHIDVVSQEEEAETEKATEEEGLPENTFSPFASDNFEQISRPK